MSRSRGLIDNENEARELDLDPKAKVDARRADEYEND